MSTRLSSSVLERSAIKFICRGSPSSYCLLSKLDESYFHNKISVAAFKRIRTVLSKRGELLSWRDLSLNDPVLPDPVKDALQSYKAKVTVNKQEERKIYNQLFTYRKRRLLDSIAQYIAQEQVKDGYDELAVTQRVGELLSQAQTRAEMEKPFIMGKGSNLKEFFEKFKNDEAERMIPIGFSDWDRPNGGLPPKSVTLVMGFTGSMKSTFVDIIACNMAESGAKVGIVSFEMFENQIIVLRGARLARIDRTEIKKKVNLVPKQWKRIYRKLKEKDEAIAAAGGSIRFHAPKKGMHKDEIFPAMQPHDYDVLIIDYPSLMGGIMDSDNFWRELMKFTGASKVFSTSSNTRTILLAQSDESDRLKLSKNMLNDCDIALSIVFQEDKKSNYMEVNTVKARDLAPVTMILKREGAFANIEDMPDEERANLNIDRKNVKNDFKKNRGDSKEETVSTRKKTAEDIEMAEYFASEDILDD